MSTVLAMAKAIVVTVFLFTALVSFAAFLIGLDESFGFEDVFLNAIEKIEGAGRNFGRLIMKKTREDK